MYFFMNYDIGHSSQTSSQSFGPQSSNEFNCTSKFTLTGADPKKAFAVQTGLLIVQEDSSGRINVAIKPILNLGPNRPVVDYYVYRGLSKSNFFITSGTDTNVIAYQSSSETDLTEEMWLAYNQNHGNTTGPIASSTLGFDSNMNGNITLQSIFNGNESVQTQPVTKGMYIGDWDNSDDIGFEVVLMNHDFFPDVDYLKEKSYSINMTGATTVAEQKARRERCLAFLDPAALYGLHYYDGVSAKDESLNETGFQEDSAYLNLIDLFDSRNRVYIDVRNEHGYSYNFYGNYTDGTDQIKLGHSLFSGTTPGTTAKKYASQDWPIHFTDVGPSSTTIGDFLLSLRMADNSNADNEKPLVFHNNATKSVNVCDQKWNFLEDEYLTNNSSNTDWTETVSIQYPNYGTGSKVNVSWYVRIHYVRQEPYAGSNGNVPKLENVQYPYFGSFHLDKIGSTLYPGNKIANPIPRLVYGQLSSTSDEYAFVAYDEVCWDDNDVIFYVNPETAFKSPGVKMESLVKDKKYRVKIPSYLNAQRKNPAWYDAEDLTVNDSSTSVDIKHLTLFAIQNIDPSKEKIQTLGITRSQVDDLEGRSGFNSSQRQFLKLENPLSVNTDPDIVGATVEAKGMADGGGYVQATGGTPFKVYI